MVMVKTGIYGQSNIERRERVVTTGYSYRFTAVMLANKLSQQKLADLLGVNRSTIKRACTGKDIDEQPVPQPAVQAVLESINRLDLRYPSTFAWIVDADATGIDSEIVNIAKRLDIKEKNPIKTHRTKQVGRVVGGNTKNKKAAKRYIAK